MYELQSRLVQRHPGVSGMSAVAAASRTEDSARPLILHMQENRSHLGREARLCFTAIAVLFMVTCLATAAKGQWLIPAFSLLAMAALTFALERHGQSRPACETLELADGHVRHSDSSGHVVELPAHWMKLATESRTPSDLRLILRCHQGAIEFGRCLSLEERRAVAPLVADALARAKRGHA